MTEELVILVDEHDVPVGVAEKLAAHRDGQLHRAFSIFVFDHRGYLLLQQRAAHKYHSRLLWSNTCCGHPKPGEDLDAAAHRRLSEEMGLDCTLETAGILVYRAQLEDGLIENEIDHLLVGRLAGSPAPEPDPNEVAAWCWCDVRSIANDLRDNPTRYTAWFAAAFGKLPDSGTTTQ